MDVSLDADNLCRACIQEINLNEIEDATTYVNIFQSPELLNKLSACISKEFTAINKYSKYLCTRCYQKVIEFYEFREMCTESMRRFVGLQQHQNAMTLQAKRPFSLLNKEVVKEEYELGGEVGTSQLNASRVLPEIVYDLTEEYDESNKNSESEIENLNENNLPVSKTRKKSIKNALGTVDDSEHNINIKNEPISDEDALEFLDDSDNSSLSENENSQEHENQSTEYACDQEGCAQVFQDRSKLLKHKQLHNYVGRDYQSHACQICGKVFISASILKNHLDTHKDQHILPYVCDQPNCMRRFAFKTTLNVHLKRHAGIKNYLCPYCGARKTTRRELKAHVNLHTLERTWTCQFCDKICYNASNLRSHVRTVHEQVKNYACRYCDLKFAKHSTLKHHEMRHTGEKPNVCPECGKGFIQPPSLRYHMKVHERERARLTMNNSVD